MWKKILVVFLVVILALSFTACAKEGTGKASSTSPKDAAKLPTTQELVDGLTESLEGIKTFQYDMAMDMDMSGTAGEEAFGMKMVMDSTAVVDYEQSQMKMDMLMDMEMADEFEMNMAMDIFFIDNTMYIGTMAVPGSDTVWMKMEIPDGMWEQMNQTESQIELLQTAPFEIIGSETVEGIDCYVVVLTPDMEQLWEMAMQQAAAGQEPVLPEIDHEFLKDIFQSFSVKQWIAIDTYYLIKSEIDMVLELTPEAMEMPDEEGGISMDISMILLVHSYNERVSIELPPEAAKAVEMPIS